MKTNNDAYVCGGCATTSTILGVIFGVIIGVLFAFCFIPFIFIGIWIALAIALVVLIYVMGVILLSSLDSSHNLSCCLHQNLNCLLTGSIGTIISAIAALSIILFTHITAIVILIAIGAFFFAFMIVSLIYFIKCVVRHS